MPKKLTTTVDPAVYDGLHRVVGRRRISRVLNDIARPHVVGQDLSAGYAATAADEAREREADTWSDGLITDGPRRFQTDRTHRPSVRSTRASTRRLCPLRRRCWSEQDANPAGHAGCLGRIATGSAGSSPIE